MLCLLVPGLVPQVPGSAAAAELYLVRDGKPQAEILIAEDPPRTTRRAAEELQIYIEKITGAKLPIGTKPAPGVPVQVYVGRSPHTDRLGIRTDDLQDGAYRMVSGENWLVLAGTDTNFTPIEPWPRSNNDIVSGQLQQRWNQVTGKEWGNPHSQLRKHYTGGAVTFGKPDHVTTDKDGRTHVWGFDERGSFNAVCDFLRDQGVRWYLPGELGEVVPERDSIALPAVNRTVRPDFAIRRFNIRFGVHGPEHAKWAMRLGMRDPYGVQIAHGMSTMTHNRATLEGHPEWFALYGGRRHNQPGQRLNHLCYSNEELIEETVRYVRTIFDHYDFKAVSVMPPDGYTAICQCPLCAGKETADRDDRGRMSDYVWEFVNRVAKEVRKTHPDRFVSCCAYGVYTLPPLKIDRLEPNVLVCIVGGRRPTNPDREYFRRLRADWAKKSANPIMIFENYPLTDRGWYLPAYQPHVLGESINATKGISQGEDIWLSVQRDDDQDAIGFNHFQVYFTARMYWGGKDQNVDELFDEYCRLFYGPAAAKMKEFFTYCETSWRAMEKDKELVDGAFERLARARSQVAAESVYGRRIGLIDTFLKSLANKGEQLARRRGVVPQVRLARDATGIVIDGQLDDEFWQKAPVHAVGSLRELQTGRQPVYGTTFKTAWGRDGSVYFAIRCEDRAGEPLNVGATRREDQAIWYGDAIEVLLETESHSYYQLAVSPAGAVVDLDRGANRSSWFRWDAQAEVATHVADGYWTVEMRIPVTDDENDPLHQVIGRKPTSSLPWYFNVCRQRIRDNGAEYSAFSPTGTSGFHNTMKFGQFYLGRVFRFDADESEDDYLAASHKAAHLLRGGKRKEALAAFAELAERDKLSDLQRSVALQQAASAARAVGEKERAAELADRIPLESVAQIVRMENLLAARQFEELIAQYGKVDFASFPFWNAGQAWALRGTAYCDAGQGTAAEKNLLEALERTTADRERLDILLTLGRNREVNLKDMPLALEAYGRIASMTRFNGGATYYRGVVGAARLLRQQQKYDEALQALQVVGLPKLKGYWRGALYRAAGEVHEAAGHRDEAIAAYREVERERGSSRADRTIAEEALKRLQGSSSN